MKSLHRWVVQVASAAFFIACAPAVAQWQAPDHSVPVGRGSGATGFKNASPGAAGNVLTSNGAASDPTFKPTSVIDVAQRGADRTGAADATTVINAAMAEAATNGGCVYIPAGTYSVSTLVFPGNSTPTHFSRPCIYGDGASSLIKQNATAAGSNNNILTIGDQVLNDTGDGVVRDLRFSAAASKVGGAAIFGKGTARLKLSNIYMLESNNLFNCIVMDGIDFHTFDNIQCFSPQFDAFQIYDGYDCGFTPITKTTSGATAANGTVISIANTSGISVGMNFYDMTIGPNTQTTATVQSINPNVSITLSAPFIFAVGSGDSIRLGGSCAGVAAYFTGNNYTFGGGRHALWIGGGIGGVYVDSFHAFSYNSSQAVLIDTSLSGGIQNREIFFGAFTDLDSNVGGNLSVAARSIGILQMNGAWMGAAGTTNVFIDAQGSTLNPPGTGALVYISNSRIGQSNGTGFWYQDLGLLTLTGNQFVSNFGADGFGIKIVPGTDNIATIVANGNTITGNSQFGVAVLSHVTKAIWNGNYWGGNAAGAQQNIAAGANVVCANNLGGTSGC